MKYKILLLAAMLGVATITPLQAQEQSEREAGVTISVDNHADSREQGSEEFIEFMRGFMGDAVANRIQEEFDNLDADDRVELEKKLADQNFRSVNINADGIGGAEATVAILAITLSLGMPIIILLMVLYFSYRKRRQRMDLIQSFVAAGKDVPEQLLDEAGETDPLRSGINLVAIGIGLLAALHMVGADEAAAFGMIPLLIGLARLGYHFLSKREKN